MSSYRRHSVSKCVCHRVSFQELKDEAKRRKLSSCNDLIQAGLCGGSCTMCHPYVEKMMHTGETEFIPGDFHYSSDP
jgi:bacterioferritin-associated ferredoxin